MEDVVCRYFVSTHGCKLGWRCPFPHITSPNRRPDTICRYFLAGTCLFGDQCWHEHTYLPFNNGSNMSQDALFCPYTQGTSLVFPEPHHTSTPIESEPQIITVTSSAYPEIAQNSISYVYDDFDGSDSMSPEFYDRFSYINEPNYFPQQVIPIYFQENLNDSLEVINVLPSMQSSAVCEDFQRVTSNSCNCNPACDAANQFSAGNDQSEVEEAEEACIHKNGYELKLTSKKKICEECIAYFPKDTSISFTRETNLTPNMFSVSSVSSLEENVMLESEMFSGSSVTSLEENVMHESEVQEQSSATGNSNMYNASPNPIQNLHKNFIYCDTPSMQGTDKNNESYKVTTSLEKKYDRNKNMKSDGDLEVELNLGQASTSRSSDDYSKDISSINIKTSNYRQNILPKNVRTSIERDDNISDCSIVPRINFKKLPGSPGLKSRQGHSAELHYFNKGNANEAYKEEYGRSESPKEKDVIATIDVDKQFKNQNSRRYRRKSRKSHNSNKGKANEAYQDQYGRPQSLEGKVAIAVKDGDKQFRNQNSRRSQRQMMNTNYSNKGNVNETYEKEYGRSQSLEEKDAAANKDGDKQFRNKNSRRYRRENRKYHNSNKGKANEAYQDEYGRPQSLEEKDAIAVKDGDKQFRNQNSRRSQRRKRENNPFAEIDRQSEANKNASKNVYKDKQVNIPENPENLLEVTKRQVSSVKGKDPKYPSSSYKSDESVSRLENSTKFSSRLSQLPEKKSNSDLCSRTVSTEKDHRRSINTDVGHHVVIDEADGSKYSGASFNRSKRHERYQRKKITSTTEQSFVENETLFPNYSRWDMVVTSTEERTIEASEKAAENTRQEGEIYPSYSMVLSRNLTKCSMCHEDIVRREIQKDRVFGILENCNHMYCLKCMYWWRCVKNNATNPSECSSRVNTSGVHCPACNSYSACIIPSKTWIENGIDKINLITRYRNTLKRIPCKYFNRGQGFCELGNDCLYLHSPSRPE